MTNAKRLRVTLFRPDGYGAGTFFVLPFDPRTVFGRARARLKVTIGRHSYRTTVAIYGGKAHVIVNEANRRAAHVDVGQTVTVLLERDDAKRIVRAPADLAAALAKVAVAKAAWARLAYTHKKEHVVAILGAKQAETRTRRIAKTITMLRTSH